MLTGRRYARLGLVAVACVTAVAAAGCDRFIVHARKAWLDGLSPHENRTVPPLRHDAVIQLKRELPHLRIELNGAIARLRSKPRLFPSFFAGAKLPL